jgi:hypothetical protein
MTRFRCKNGTIQQPAKSRKCVSKKTKMSHTKKNEKLSIVSKTKKMTDVSQRKLQVKLVKAHLKAKISQLKPVLKTLSKAEKKQANAYYDELYWSSNFGFTYPKLRQKYIDTIDTVCNISMETNLEKAYAYQGLKHLLGELEVHSKSYFLEEPGFSTDIVQKIIHCYKDTVD